MLLLALLLGTGCSLIDVQFNPAAPFEAQTLPAGEEANDASEPAGAADPELPTDEQLAGVPATLAAVARAMEDNEYAAAPEDPPSLRELKEYMLGLINSDRKANGLDPVALGNNAAAQRHAEDLLEHNYVAHWGRDGLKPYMRYTLAGGVDYEGENVSGPVLREAGVRYQETPARESLRDAEIGLMNSPGHRRNILNPWHKKVNLGIACDPVDCAVVQQFQGDYVEFHRRPELIVGKLYLEGNLKEGFELDGVQVWYDPPAHPLTLGQLDATYSYWIGWPAVFLRPPLPAGREYLGNSANYDTEIGVDPYAVDPKTPRLKLLCDGDECALPPKPAGQGVSVVVPWITADTWEASGGYFQVEADISPVVNALGPGVYTVSIWGDREGESVSLTRYSIFVE